jgi:hypothetical protein
MADLTLESIATARMSVDATRTMMGLLKQRADAGDECVMDALVGLNGAIDRLIRALDGRKSEVYNDMLRLQVVHAAVRRSAKTALPLAGPLQHSVLGDSHRIVHGSMRHCARNSRCVLAIDVSGNYPFKVDGIRMHARNSMTQKPTTVSDVEAYRGDELRLATPSSITLQPDVGTHIPVDIPAIMPETFLESLTVHFTTHNCTTDVFVECFGSRETSTAR